MSLNKLALFGFAVAISSAGCFVTPTPYDGGPHGGGGGGGVYVAPTDDATPLGIAAMPGYHVSAGSASELPAGDLGFVITANGSGGYRLTWSDTLGSAAHFSGTITCDTTFDPTQLRGYSGYENIDLSSDDTVISFDSVPGNQLDGVDLVSGSDPIYLDLLVDGVHSGFSIYFTGAYTSRLLTSQYDPVAFTSP